MFSIGPFSVSIAEDGPSWATMSSRAVVICVGEKRIPTTDTSAMSAGNMARTP